MSKIGIPDAALEAAARAIQARVDEPGQCSYADMARAALECEPPGQNRKSSEELSHAALEDKA